MEHRLVAIVSPNAADFALLALHVVAAFRSKTWQGSSPLSISPHLGAMEFGDGRSQLSKRASGLLLCG